jgi:hypothetical protein
MSATGELVLHPQHPLFLQFQHPACPECKREIFPMTPVDLEYRDDGLIMFRHAECAQNEPEPEVV